MFGEKQREYIHIYMDMAEDTIYFHSTSTPYRLGEKILDFVYTDLDEAFSSVETFRTLHPYFSKWSFGAFRKLFEASDSEEKNQLTCKKIQQLQTDYKALLGAFTYGTETVSEDICRYLLKHPFDVRETLVNETIRDKKRWLSDYFVVGFEDCLMCEFMEMLHRHKIIKICKNCGRYFLPKRGNIEYCTRYYTQDGKSCADVGYTKTFEKTVKKDELLQAYTRAYKTHYARMTKPRKKTPNMTRDEFESWYKQAKHGLELARRGEMDAEAYKAWLKK